MKNWLILFKYYSNLFLKLEGHVILSLHLSGQHSLRIGDIITYIKVMDVFGPFVIDKMRAQFKAANKTHTCSLL